MGGCRLDQAELLAAGGRGRPRLTTLHGGGWCRCDRVLCASAARRMARCGGGADHRPQRVLLRPRCESSANPIITAAWLGRSKTRLLTHCGVAVGLAGHAHGVPSEA